MSRWPTQRLGDLLSLEYGKALPETIRDSAGKFVVAGSNGPQGIHSEALVKAPGIVIGRKGSAGQINWYDQDFWPIDTTYYVVPKAQINYRWLFYCLRTTRLPDLATATGVPGLNRNDVYDIRVIVPPLPEQERIVRILDEAEALRRLRAQADERTRSAEAALFEQMFGSPSPDWPRDIFGNLGSLDRGRSKHRPRDEPSLFGGPYPFIQTGDVANSSGRITTFTQTYSELGLAQSRLWPAGTLCITIAANIAKTGVLGFDACFPDSVVGFNAGDRVTVEFVQAWLSTLQGRLEEEAPQAAQKNINLKTLRELEMAVPPIALQQVFAARVAEVRELEAAQAASRQRLDNLFQSLLHHAFQGEL